MASAIKIKWDQREFQKTLREYALLSSRAPKVITDTKAFYIARRAVVETPAVDAEEIRRFALQEGGAVLGKIINARRGKKGEPGLYGQAMAKAVAVVKAARLRSRAFLKSGWLWAVKKLAPYAEKVGSAPRMTGTKPKLIGQAKGTAKPAQSGWRAATDIVNTVTAAWDTREGAKEYAEPALERAFEAERQSMLQYMERKFKDAAKKAGIATGH